MKKKTLAAIGLGVIAAVSLSACTAGASDAGTSDTGEVTLKFLTHETPNLTAEYWEESIERTNALVPGVKIERLVTPNNDRDAYVRQLDSTGELPDIMIAINTGGLAESGKLAEFEESELSNWIDPTANSHEGKIYQLPTNTQTIPNVFYNKAAFAEAGITETPKTWDEMLAAAEKLKTAGITPLVVNGGGADTWANIYPFAGLVGTDVYAKNPDFLGDLASGKTDFTDPDFVAAVTKFKDLVDKGYIDSTVLAQTYAEGQEAFLNGKGGMYPMGSWFTVTPTAEQQEEIGVFAWPSNDGSLIMPTYTGGGLSVSASAPDVAKAKEWALAWSQVEENLTGGVLTDGLFVALKDYKLPEGTTKLYNESIAIYEDAIETGTVTPVFGNEGGIPSLPNGFAGEVQAGITDLVNSRLDVDGFVKQLNQKYAELTD